MLCRNHRLFHDWTNWMEAGNIKLMKGKNLFRLIDIQERICKRCDKRKVRRIPI